MATLSVLPSTYSSFLGVLMSVRRFRAVAICVGISLSAAGIVAVPATAFATSNGSGHGANVSGPYTGDSNGSPSQNGNGGGNAKGRPCAGCVGNADDKNPPGQLPGGNDHNNGYECDGNHGIGRTNPAHTGCITTTTVAPTTTTAAPVTTTIKPTTTTVLVLGNQITTTTTTEPDVDVLGAVIEPTAPTTMPAVLAETGVNTTTMMYLGLALFALGSLIMSLRQFFAGRLATES
jgi:hypothetical protein